MKASDLKASILQLAVSGKLVAQDSNDEPANVFLQRIQAERKTSRVRGEVLPEVSEYEQPFTTPASWVWTRLGNIGTWSAGGTPSRTKTEYYFNGTIPWLKSGDLNDGFITHSDEKITDLATKETRVPINKIGSLVVALYGATIGKTGILSIEATTNQACCVCNIYVGIDNRYLIYYIISQRASLKKSGAGRAQPNISKEKLVAYPIPLPPLAEQQRIVARIEELMPLIEAYDHEEQKLSALEAGFPDALRQSILQYAVEGKLVPQKAEDGTAAELLAKIRKERDALVKEGKIKKGKPLPPVSEEEKPYDIPESWEWVRLGDIMQLISGRDLTPEEYADKMRGIPYLIGASNVEDGIITVERWTEQPKVISLEHDLLLSCKGTIGKTAIQILPLAHIARQFMSLRPYFGIDIFYIKIFIDNYVPILISQAKSMIPGISREDVLPILCPLPPLSEQRRIVERVEELMGLCDRIPMHGK